MIGQVLWHLEAFRASWILTLVASDRQVALQMLPELRALLEGLLASLHHTVDYQVAVVADVSSSVVLEIFNATSIRGIVYFLVLICDGIFGFQLLQLLLLFRLKEQVEH